MGTGQVLPGTPERVRSSGEPVGCVGWSPGSEPKAGPRWILEAGVLAPGARCPGFLDAGHCSPLTSAGPWGVGSGAVQKLLVSWGWEDGLAAAPATTDAISVAPGCSLRC